MKNLLLLSLWVLLFSEVSAQQTPLLPLPFIRDWADNEHYIIREGDRELMVNIHSGKKTPRQRPEEIRRATVRIDKGDIFYHDGKKTQQLTDTPAQEINPVLSPDGKWVAFTRNNDLYVINIPTGEERRLTRDGSDVILNGYASWVYYEEILSRASQHRAFWWSPDSQHLAFFRSNDSQVPLFPLYNATGQHGYLKMTRYPKAGDPNPQVKIGLAAVESGKIVWADFDPEEDQYFGEPFWQPDGKSLLVQWMCREQNELKFYRINLQNGEKTEIYNEQQESWIDWISGLHWTKDGFLMIRDFDGWEQIYYHDTSGRLKHKLTNGNNWKTRILRVDEESQTLFYCANAELSTRSDLYSVRLNGKEQQRLTFGNYSHHNLLISPDGKHILSTFGNAHTPDKIALIKSGREEFTVIADSRGPGFREEEYTFPEMVWLTTREGFRLPGKISWPAKLDQQKQYPVIISIYGGPNMGSVYERWDASTPGYSNTDYILVEIDHRGSGHCGKAGLNYLHRNLGKWEMTDYISWVQWLKEKPFVDPNRIFIQGGSYGGYLTALALTYGAEHFQFGISQFPVIDWMLYDSHYTERYMDHPQDNPEGYRQASVLTHADNYQKHGLSMLKIEHGAMDDNVHIQNSLQLVDLFQKLNKSFEFMVYPNERHGWGGPKSRFTRSEHQRFLNQWGGEKKPNN